MPSSILEIKIDAAGALLRRYVHGPGIDEPVVMLTGSGTTNKQYYHADYQGIFLCLALRRRALTSVRLAAGY